MEAAAAAAHEAERPPGDLARPATRVQGCRSLCCRARLCLKCPESFSKSSEVVGLQGEAVEASATAAQEAELP